MYEGSSRSRLGEAGSSHNAEGYIINLSLFLFFILELASLAPTASISQRMENLIQTQCTTKV